MAKKVILKKRGGLGKGLSALLSDSDTSVAQTGGSPTPAGVQEIPVGEIEVNPFQPRTDFAREALEELAESIRIQGIIQPVTVRRLEENSYQLISGERRLQASKIAGLETIPAYIRTADDQQMLEMALVENIQREDLNPIEVALSYTRLMEECSLKQEELGDRVGKKRATVNNYMRLLKLPPEIQAGLRAQKLSMGHARALINVDDTVNQITLYKRILEDQLSVRKVEELVRNLLTTTEKEPKKKPTPKTVADLEIDQIRHRLSDRFGTRIRIARKDDSKGEISIPFVSDEDFNRILDILEENKNS